MCQTTANICLIARQALRAPLLGVLVLAASIPAGSLAAVAVTSGGSGQPGASVRDVVLQVRGSS